MRASFSRPIGEDGQTDSRWRPDEWTIERISGRGEREREQERERIPGADDVTRFAAGSPWEEGMVES